MSLCGRLVDDVNVHSITQNRLNTWPWKLAIDQLHRSWRSIDVSSLIADSKCAIHDFVSGIAFA